MDWTDAAKAIGKVAPGIGAAVGGPAGSAVGGLIATALGVDSTPEAVAQAASDPDAAIKLKKIEQEHEREILSLTLQAETTRLSEINKTMRAETQTDSTFRAGWRPFNGWMLAISLATVNIGLVAIVVRDPTQLTQVVDVLIWSVVAQGAVQGVNIKKRSDDKALQMGQKPASFMDMIRKR